MFFALDQPAGVSPELVVENKRNVFECNLFLFIFQISWAKREHIEKAQR